MAVKFSWRASQLGCFALQDLPDGLFNDDYASPVPIRTLEAARSRLAPGQPFPSQDYRGVTSGASESLMDRGHGDHRWPLDERVSVHARSGSRCLGKNRGGPCNHCTHRQPDSLPCICLHSSAQDSQGPPGAMHHAGLL